MTLEEKAKELAGNWKNFGNFIWFRASEIPDADQWALVYTKNGGSGLLEESNAAYIEKKLKPFTEGEDPDVVMESHNHWLVNSIDGFSVRVYNAAGEITEAFKTYFEIQQRKDDYPILDESDYSEREFEASYANVGDAAWRVKGDYVLPEDWQSEVHYWLGNNTNALENTDDQGGYPDESELIEAFTALKYKKVSKAKRKAA